MSVPSGEKRTERTQLVWLWNGLEIACPLRVFHTLMVASVEPEATSVPSGEKASESTAPPCPSSGSKTGCPLCASHIRIVLSHEPEATRALSGEKATDLTGPSCSSGPATIRPVIPSMTYTANDAANAISDPSGDKQAIPSSW